MSWLDKKEPKTGETKIRNPGFISHLEKNCYTLKLEISKVGIGGLNPKIFVR